MLPCLEIRLCLAGSLPELADGGVEAEVVGQLPVFEAAKDRARGFAPIRARVALAYHLPPLPHPPFGANSPAMRRVIVRPAGAALRRTALYRTTG
jgi:hypothetical protein